MNIHKGARSCAASRLLLVRRVLEEGWSVAEAAEAAGLSTRSGFKWLRRFRDEGEAGLVDRTSRPRRSRQTCPDRVALVVELRHCRMSAPQIAERLKMPRSTVSRVLRRAGVGKLRALLPKEPVRRYEKTRPGELVHLDVKKLGRFERPGHRVTGRREGQSASRGVGWEFVHVCVDDYTRLAYVEVLDDERGHTAAGFLERAAAWFRRHGVRIEKVLTDNGSCYRSHAFAAACKRLSARRSFTRAYRPQTNGKAERFIQTMLREWAYRRPYRSHRERKKILPLWLRRYNFHRAHGSLDRKPPSSRLSSDQAEQRV